MKGMIFKKAFLLGGIFLLATFMSVQLSWSCDDDDKWDCDHHDKWRCDHHAKPCHPTKIQRVFLDYESDSITFIILGKNFDKGMTPVVTLGGIYDLTVVEPLTENQIVAELFPIPEGFKYGDYRLVVSTCRGSACNDKYCKDHGSNCKCKYCKEHCSKCKDKYCKDNEYKCRCRDRYSLTIPDPAGPPGPPGTIESLIVENAGAFDNPTTPRKIDGHAYYDTARGYTVTGGGFKSNNIKIIESRADGNGWYVLGRITNDDSEDPVALTIHAVCAKIK